MTTTLAERAVLLSWDPARKKLRGGERRALVSAAVLVDLWAAGHAGSCPPAAARRPRPCARS